MQRPKIVILDGNTLNPGDLSWDALGELGDVALYDRTPLDLIVERTQGAEVAITNKVPFAADTLAQLPALRYIGVTATGYNIIDIEAADRHGVWVTNVPTYGTTSVAQFTIALLLELCHRVQTHADAVREGEWNRRRDFSFFLTNQMELDGKTLGIVGLGRIGSQVARIAQAFGMDVLAAARSSGSTEARDGIRRVDLDTLLENADVVSLHCPLTPETEGLIREETLRRMKPTSFLLNTSRGGLVVDQDLADALNQGRIAGAALDVISTEPPDRQNPLLGAKNCIITPHMAWSTKEARRRLLDATVENLRRFLEGTPVNVVQRGR